MTNARDRLDVFDIGAREAQVVGSGPRIAAIPDADIPPEIRAAVNQTRASVGLGPAAVLPEYTRLVAKSPTTFVPHMNMGTAIFSGQIPPRLRELAVLRVAWVCGAPFEWSEHVIIAKRYGVTSDEVERVTHGTSRSGWTAHEAAIVRGVDELILDQTLHDETYTELARHWPETQLIQYLMTVGHYVATAFVQNSLRTRIAEGNPGLRLR